MSMCGHLWVFCMGVRIVGVGVGVYMKGKLIFTQQEICGDFQTSESFY